MAPQFRAALEQLARRQSLSRAQSGEVFGQIMDGAVPEAGIAALLMGLRVCGETTDELAGAVSAMRARMVPVAGPIPEGAMDVCGTGGDGLGTLNVSTAVAFVLAALGVPVAKHGNRALSSRSGAADVVAALGVTMPQGGTDLGALLRAENLVFLSAPQHHPAMRHAAAVRRTLGIRTIFNLMGPLSNPAGVRRQLLGVFDAAWLHPMVETARAMGADCVWAVHGRTGRGGIDELTLAGESLIAAFDGQAVRDLVLTPEMAGLRPAPIEAIIGGSPAENAQALIALLRGEGGAYRDTVLLNTAVALHVADRGSILAGVDIAPAALRAHVQDAARVLDNGAAYGVLEAMRGQTYHLVPAEGGTGKA